MNIKMRCAVASVAIITILGIWACSKSPSSDSQPDLWGSYDQSSMLNNIGTNFLQKNIDKAASDALAVQSAVEVFTSRLDESTLINTQTAWANLAQSWAAVEPFGFGPLQDNLISSNIDDWPIDPAKIEEAIRNHSAVSSLGADAKGLKALEYMLFDEGGNSLVQTKLSSASDAKARDKYLQLLAQDIVGQTKALQDAWQKTYLKTFTTAKGNDVSSSVSQLVNAISLALDQVKNMKVGNPIGMGIKMNDNMPHPDMIEYTKAEQSLAVMKLNLAAMKDVFDGGSGQGLDDLLNYAKAEKNGQHLSVVVDKQFDDAIAQIDAITPPFADAVRSQSQKIKDEFNSLKTLIAYFKVDIANNLGVTITFSDTDGD